MCVYVCVSLFNSYVTFPIIIHIFPKQSHITHSAKKFNKKYKLNSSQRLKMSYKLIPHTHTRTYVYIYIYIYICIYMYMYIYVFIHVYICYCISMYLYTFLIFGQNTYIHEKLC